MLLIACKKEIISPIDQNDNPKIDSIDSQNTITISGCVQKGPYLIGTTVNLIELDSSYNQTGKIFKTEISDKNGGFKFNGMELDNSYAILEATGYYFNEVTGKNSDAMLTLKAFVNLTDSATLNINLMTHLEFERVLSLMKTEKDYNHAKEKAQSEVLSIFGLKSNIFSDSEKLDITKEGDENGILLAISILLQNGYTVASLSEQLANLKNQIADDGLINDTSFGLSLATKSMNLNLKQIRKNLEEGLTIDPKAIPPFEKYINQFQSQYKLDFTSVIDYPVIGLHGTNILNVQVDTVEFSQEFSMAANLSNSQSIKIVMSGGLWAYYVAPNGPINWLVNSYNDKTTEQTFRSVESDKKCDLRIFFIEKQELIQNGVTPVRIDYYENYLISDIPTFSRVLNVKSADYSKTLEYPKNGEFGTNLLAMNEDTIRIAPGEYSLKMIHEKEKAIRSQLQFRPLFIDGKVTASANDYVFNSDKFINCNFIETAENQIVDYNSLESNFFDASIVLKNHGVLRMNIMVETFTDSSQKSLVDQRKIIIW